MTARARTFDRPLSRASAGLAIVVVLAAAATVAARQEAQSSAPAPPDPADLEALYEARDYFALRDRLDAIPEVHEPRIELLRAAVLRAFNRPAASNELLDRLLADDAAPLPADLRQRALALRHFNHFRLHEYKAAYDAGRQALRLAGPGAGDLSGMRDSLPLLRALVGVEPQFIDIAGRTQFTLYKGRLAVQFGDDVRQYLFDSTAPLSVLARSEAEALGLEIRKADAPVATATDLTIIADVAVAPEMRIGYVEYRNVVFLVLPDEQLRVGDDLIIDGIIGFPAIEAMIEVRYGRDGSIEIPRDAPARREGNLALEQVDPLAQVEFAGDIVIARLDRSAAVTTGHAPFHERFRQRIESAALRHDAPIERGERTVTVPSWRMDRLEFNLAGRTVALEGVDIFAAPLPGREGEYAHLTIGRDALDKFRTVIINYRDMALVLEE